VFEWRIVEDRTERDELVMSILAEVLRRPSEQREPFLRSACNGDADLYDEIAEAAEWDDKMGSFLKRPLIDFAAFAPPFQPGQVILERYLIVREVGEGGMGVVYEAFDQKRQSRIAIKAAKPGFERFMSPELEGALKVRHHNICLVNDVRTTQTQYGEVDFLTMEFLDGENLSRHLLQAGHFEHKEGIDLACQLCAGLEVAHRSGIIHRDLKSDNVMLCRNHDGSRRAVITDFGLAGGLTLQSREMGGTPVYMAPELLEGARASKASDIYALGVILYEMVTGQRPAETHISDETETHRPAAPSAIVRGLDPRWDSVILQCFDPSPSARPANVSLVAATLRKRAARKSGDLRKEPARRDSGSVSDEQREVDRGAPVVESSAV
jgi:serine/threonine protein kinase